MPSACQFIDAIRMRSFMTARTKRSIRSSIPLLVVLMGSTLQGAQVERWTVRELVRIGEADDAVKALTGIGDVLVGNDRLIYIGQPTEQAIKVFDQAGRFVRSMGGDGEGPGEFRSLLSIGFVGDTLYATDHRLRRVTLFRSDGSTIQTFERATPLIGDRQIGIYSPTVPTVLLPDGTALAQPLVPLRRLAAGHDRVPTFRLSADGESVDTIAETEIESSNAVINIGERRVGVQRPFMDSPIHAYLADRSGILQVHRRVARRPERAAFTVVKIGLTGDTVFRRDFAYVPIAVSDEMIGEAVAKVRDRITSDRNAPSASQIRAALVGGDHIPRMSPPVTDVASGIDGSIWLRREMRPGNSVVWDVLNSEGRLQARVELANTQVVKFVNKDVLVVADRDALDVPFIVMFRLQGSAAR